MIFPEALNLKAIPKYTKTLYFKEGIIVNHAFQALESLVEVANETSSNKYEIIPFALGFIPFRNNINMTIEIGNSFMDVARWLLSEIENNFNN